MRENTKDGMPICLLGYAAFEFEEPQTVRMFHVSPYANAILRSGEILPPSITRRATLGENEMGRGTIRGHLISCFSTFQNALNGAFALALFALMSKDLISANDLKATLHTYMQSGKYSSGWGQADWESDEPEESEDEAALFAELDRALTNPRDLFRFLSAHFGQVDPAILTDRWVLDLPDSVEGVLDSIGVFEIETSRKFIIDPAVLVGDVAGNLYVAERSPVAEITGHDLVDTAKNTDVYTHLDDAVDMLNVVTSDIALLINRTLDGRRTRLCLTSDPLRSGSYGDVSSAATQRCSLPPKYGDCFKDPVSGFRFVSKLEVDLYDTLVWNPLENEWRVPTRGEPVSEANLIANGSEIFEALRAEQGVSLPAVFTAGISIRGRRKNPRRY